jgi:hypothetical protein
LVGSEVESICGKCGQMTHVVIALVEGRIAKVECHQCGARHRYRPIGADAVTPRGRAASGPRRRSPKSGALPSVEADPTRPRRPFRATETYRPGDRILHAIFGEGVVQAITGTTKIQVRFEAGTKTLIHARPSD